MEPRAGNVLLTCAGRRVELTRAFGRALAALGGGKVFCCDSDPTAPALHAADGAFAMPPLGDPSYEARLEEICAANGIGLVVPTIDTELGPMASMRDSLFERTGARIAVSSPGCVALCADKRRLARFFAGNGVDAPRTFEAAAAYTGAGAGFPAVVKPARGSSSIDVFVARDVRELEFFASYVREPVVQERLSGAEFSVDALFDFESRPVAAVSRRRIATRGGEILKGRVEMRREVLEPAERLLGLLGGAGARGAFTLQGFLGADGRFRFTEVNARFGGGAPMSVAAGADLPRWLCELAAGGRPSPATIRDGAQFSRFDDSFEIAANKPGQSR